LDDAEDSDEGSEDDGDYEDDDEDDDDDDDDDDDEDEDEDDDEDASSRYDSETQSPTLNELSIDASSTSITSFPAELLDLKLSSLRLCDNPSLRSIPSGLVEMPSLTNLDCSGCTSLGEVHAHDRQPWSGWPAERREAVLAGLEGEDAMDGELSIDLDRTGFAEVPAFLARVRRPVHASFRDSRIAAWPPVAVGPKLVSMTISGTAVATIPSLAECGSLVTLSMQVSGLREMPAALNRCVALETLEVPGLPESGYPSDLSGLAKLATLRIAGPGLLAVPRFVATLPALETLVIEDASITELPEWLGRCRSLRTIEVQRAPLRTIHPAVLGIPSLRGIEVESRTLEAPEFPSGCALEKIQFGGPPSLVIPASIARCQCLRDLNLSGVEHAVFPESLASMHWLADVACGSGPHWDRAKAWLRQRLPTVRLS
jgi:Leucine-rich repeat (LRR) protein